MDGASSIVLRRKSRLALLGLLVFALFCPAVSAAGIESGGTGVGLGVLEHLATAFDAAHAGREVHVIRPSPGSGGGIKEVAAAVDEAVARPGMVFFETDQDAADAIGRIDGAVGGTALALIRTEHRNLRALPLNGVVPDPDSLADGRYPYAISLSLVAAKAPSADVASFLEFTRSDAAAAILRAAGCLPAPR